MAEIDKSRESQNEHFLHYWLLDFACHRAFAELSENKSVQNTDFIQGVLHMPQDQEKGAVKVHLLLLMCKLTNGEDYSTRYVVDSDLTVLEEVLTSFDMIIKSFYQDSDLRKNSSKIRLAIMKQAVYVCCRAGDFDMADTVFTRQWTDIEDAEKKQRSAVQAIIKSKNPSHPSLKSATYQSFVDQIIMFIKEILDTFPEPFLLKVNKVYAELINKTDNDEDEDAHHTPRKKRRRSFQKLPSNALSSPLQENLQKKVHRIRKEKLNGIVSAALGDTNNSNHANTESNSMSTSYTEDVHDEEKESHDGPRSPETLAESAKQVAGKLRMRTKNLMKTVTAVKENTRDCASSSSPEQSPVKKTRRKTPQKSPRQADESSQDEWPDPRHRHDRKNHNKSPQTSKSRSDETVPDSSSKDIRRFQYRRNKNRSNRYDRPPTSDSVSDDDSADDDFPGDLPRLTGRPRVRRSLQLRNGSPTRAIPSIGSSRKIFWTAQEEKEFYRAVCTIGVGKWAEIKTYLNTFRTQVNLKDKWRQLIKSGKIKELEKTCNNVDKR